MKKFISFLLLLTFAFALVGCGVGDGGTVDFSESQGKKTKLRIWLDDEDENYGDALAAAFHRHHPEIVVEFVHQGTVDSRDLLKTYGKSGNAADIFQFPHDHMAQALLEDLVYALPDSLKEKLDDTILPLALDIATLAYDPISKEFGKGAEKLYAVPISIESVGLYYNIDLLNQIHGEDNWTLPETMEQLFEEADFYMNDENRQPASGDAIPGGRVIVGMDGDNPVYSNKYYFVTGSHWADQYFNQFIYSAFDNWRPFGEDGDDDSAVGFEKQGLQDALQYMITELKPRVTGTGSHDSVSGISLFEEGKQPYILSGPWNIANFRNAGINFSITQLPTINGNPTRTFAGAQMLAIYKYSKNIEAATKFMEFLGTPEAAEILYSEEGDLPALLPEILDTIPGLNADPLIDAISEQLKTSIPMPTIPAVTYYWGPGETMSKNIWNSNFSILDEVKKAEQSYRAAKALATN